MGHGVSASRDGPSRLSENDVAIVGMAGRFPGATDADLLWDRIVRGEDCLVDLSERDLLAAGVDRGLLDDPQYVRRNGIVEGVDLFDPAFFGIGPRDAAVMDPQHRLLLECAWEAMETAGRVPEDFDGSIGVFAGCGVNTYLLHNLLTNPQLVDDLGWFLIRHTANDKDFLSTGISYRLDLRGPSVNVQTACSTSLVAVHLACQSLLAFECDMALAGGATIEVPHGVGYRFQEGEILSPTGRCRAFDETSDGTVLTSGAGMVALRRAIEAERDGDPILALVKASAVNNDGARKVGYLAPSVDGHADVVREALELAEIDARTISLLEAHGTGTAVGDPIEVAALTEAFRASTGDVGFCRLVSTKPNIGHLDTAAGVASLIKVVQALRHRQLPPLANHRGPSPLLDIGKTPFVLSGEAALWESAGPRRAGVSSLGVGGTNAHVIVEEAPESVSHSKSPPEQVLCLSARTTAALDRTADRLATFLEAAEGLDLGDVAFTLSEGRRAMPCRRVVTATSLPDAVVQLRTGDRSRSHDAVVEGDEPGVVFLFPGGGAQYAGMTAGLDDRFEVFHDTLARGIQLVQQLTGVDLGPCFTMEADAAFLERADVSLPAVFLTEVALARQWVEWGVTPRAMAGHSLGEYAAAHLAGVFSLEDAIRVVATRAQLMSRVGGSGTAMLSVATSPELLRELLPDTLSLAVVNTPTDCVVSGPASEIDAFAAVLEDRDVDSSVLPLALAAHSSLLDPILEEFGAFMGTVELHEPTLPYVSNLTGTWVTTDEATSPEYWVRHLRGTVRFAECLATALGEGDVVTVELGPGQTLSSFARRMPTPPVAAVPVLRHPRDGIDDTAHTAGAFGRLWAHGVRCRPAVTIGVPARRVRLPATAFDRQRYWIEPGTSGASTGIVAATVTSAGAVDERRGIERIPDIADWGWELEYLDAGPTPHSAGASGPWLIVGDDDDERVHDLAKELVARGEVVEITTGVGEHGIGDARSVCVVAPLAGPDAVTDFDRALQLLLVDSSVALRALADQHDSGRLVIVTEGAIDVEGPAARPEHSLAFGPALVGEKEYPHITTRVIDIAPSTDTSTLAAELAACADSLIVLREGRRMRRALRRHRLRPVEASWFREGGTYVVTGGLGEIGFAIAEHLVATARADVAIVTSSSLPDVDAHRAYLAHHGSGDPTVRRIRRLQRLASHGTRVHLVVADVADPTALRAALDDVERELGQIDGVIHTAGRLRDRLLETVSPEDHEVVAGPKARGAIVLADELKRRGVRQLVLVSSSSTVLAPAGQTSYVGANAVLDALAGRRGDLDVRTIGFGVWGGAGMAVTAARRGGLGIGGGDPVAHPVFHERVDDEAGRHRFVGELDARHDWIVDEHRVESGTAVLPGTGHLDLMLSALALTGLPPCVGRVSLIDPLVVGDDSATVVRVTIDPPGSDGHRAVRVESDLGTGRSWFLHSEGEHIADPTPLDDVGPVPETGDLDPLARPRRHLHLGSRWSSLNSATRRNGSVVARMELPADLCGEAELWTIHPGMADVATACAAALDEREDDVLFVPVAYERVLSAGPLSGKLRVSADRASSSTADVLVADIRIADDRGAVLASMEGVELRAVTEFEHLLERPEEALDEAVATLLDAAIEAGIRSEEGPEGLERALADLTPHLVVSSLDLLELERLDTRVDPVVSDTAAGSSADGGLLGLVVSSFEELLGVAVVTPDDDFFELGGHSLIAIRLLTKLRHATGVRLQLSTLFEAPTPSALVERLIAEDSSLGERLVGGAETTPSATPQRSVLHPSLVPVRAQGSARPLFVVHGAGGNVLNLWGIARHLPQDRPVFGIQAEGIDGESEPDPTIFAMAARYVEAVRSVQPEGPYLLGGYSGGGVVALEMAKLLQAGGEDVPLVVLLDTIPRTSERPTAMRRYRNALVHAVQSGPRSVMPYVRYSLGMRYGLIPHDIEGLGLGFGDTTEHGVVNLADHFEAVIDAHEFTTYEVDVVIAKAEKVYPAWPWHYGWKNRVLGRIDTFVSPGNHFEMFTSDNAPVLAELLTPFLEAADRY